MTDIKTKKTFVAVSAVWFERYLECSRNQGTDEFPKSVWRFFHSLTNIGDGKRAIKDIVKKYVDEYWYPNLLRVVEADCKDNNVDLQLDYDASNRRLIYTSNEQREIVNLFTFIVQTVQNSGLGWPSEEEFKSYMGRANER